LIFIRRTVIIVFRLIKKNCKIWNRHTGKNLTSIEPGYPLNDFCNIPGSGLICLTNDAPKVLVYYIPALGNAPKWCTFLDNITEELEEKPTDTVYDDYKFLTLKELETLGLSHLIGSNLLRAYMHGYFMDMRLYNQAKTVAEPFAFNEYRKKKLREKLDLKREKSRVPLPMLPKVNKDLAEKLLIDDRSESTTKNKNKTKANVGSVLKDSRFQNMFTNPDYQIDVNSEHFKNVAPLIARLDKQKLIDDEDEKRQEINEDDNEDTLDDDIDMSADDDSTDDEKQQSAVSSLIPMNNVNDMPNIRQIQEEQQALKTLSFRQRALKASTPTTAEDTSTIQVRTNKKSDANTVQDERKNVRRAPRGKGERGRGRGRGRGGRRT